MRRMLLRSTLAIAALAAGGLGALPSSLSAADEAPIPRLEKHPYADARPGEWRRVRRTVRGETRFYVERVLAAAAQEGKVFYDVLETTEDGSQRRAVAERGHWADVPKFQPVAGQQYRTDEMVVIEAAGKKLAARHLKIVEPVDPRVPNRMRTRDVWYSNDVLGSGKVKEDTDEPQSALMVLAWGTMAPADLVRARELAKRIDGHGARSRTTEP